MGHGRHPNLNLDINEILKDKKYILNKNGPVVLRIN